MKADEPVHLVEDAETGDRFLIYDGEKGLRLDIRYEGETLWMTQDQIARLFGRERSVITKHIANILEEGELDEETSVQKMHTSTGREYGAAKLARRHDPQAGRNCLKELSCRC